MMVIKRVHIANTERGFLYRDRNFEKLLEPGTHWIFDPMKRVEVQVAPLTTPFIPLKNVDEVVKSGALDGIAKVIDLKDYERGIVWTKGRFLLMLGPGQYVYWTIENETEVEVADIRNVLFEHEALSVLTNKPAALSHLHVRKVEEHDAALLYVNGKFVRELPAGQYAFWRDVGMVEVRTRDLREQIQEVGGQEIMTADRVTLRMNASLTYKVVDARKSIEATANLAEALYRDTQLALRAYVGKRELDELLEDKESASDEMLARLKTRGEPLGVAIIGFGIKDIILPGEMKNILNQVMEAKKSAEASVITRREETASIRHQANTAKVFASNPELMRLRELEVLEKVAASGKLTVIAGEKLAEKVTNLI